VEGSVAVAKQSYYTEACHGHMFLTIGIEIAQGDRRWSISNRSI
jgi:hypothetical protein